MSYVADTHPIKPRFVFRNRHFFMVDCIALILTVILSFALRLETFEDAALRMGVIVFLMFAGPIWLGMFMLTGVYRQHWRSASASELLTLSTGCFFAITLTTFAIWVLDFGFEQVRAVIPLSIPILHGLLMTLVALLIRFTPRAMRYWRLRSTPTPRPTHNNQTQTLIIGAGYTGIQVLDSFQNASQGAGVCGFLDDDLSKVGTYIRGVPVLGRLREIRETVQHHHITQVIIAIPSAPGTLIRQVAAECQQLGIAHKIVPGLYELATGNLSVSQLRPVLIDDLLRREQVALNTDDIHKWVTGRQVLITGAGGSIGSELARQLAQVRPAGLILLGHGENSLFGVEARLKNEFPDVPCQIVLSDVRDAARMEALFEQYRPEIVFHAAAHKHVPMLETNVVEAVTNNVLSAQILIRLCNRHAADRMVLISTDKAVNPTSVMGMSKRIAELLILEATRTHPERFAAVRFGNVLGSRGSVIPTFQAQIANGGPITVTSPDITRFFMSIPEAVLLVMKAGVLRKEGPLFVLNMGESIKIIDLARDLIRLNGLEPDRDIEVKITGLRPGEKLYEDLFWAHETPTPVQQGRIFSVHSDVSLMEVNGLKARIERLMDVAKEYNEPETLRILRECVMVQPEPNAIRS
jgi:FlaA1/EpsC-like NDP-sugar epimerase